jgi:hypothetical protein
MSVMPESCTVQWTLWFPLVPEHSTNVRSSVVGVGDGVMVFVELAVHELETPDVPPAVSHSWFCCVSVGTLVPLFLITFVVLPLSASAMCPLPIATVLPTNTAASAATSTVVILWLAMLVISQKLSSTKVYLRCFTASANSIGEIVDIFKV